MLKQVKVPIKPDTKYSELYAQLSEAGTQAVESVLWDLESLLKHASAQSEEGASHAPKITTEMGCIDWARECRTAIFNKWRALAENCSVYTFIQGKRVLLREMIHPQAIDIDEKQVPVPTASNAQQQQEAGCCFYDKAKRLLLVKCNDGWVGLRKLQFEGKKTVDAEQFSNALGLGKQRQTTTSAVKFMLQSQLEFANNVKQQQQQSTTTAQQQG
eukprot:GEZU01014839.1.p1 GENE.GEZU01014839.1~~GEZU01014839.1.p1  ORF type:complete len:215 (-),score=100.80 GEZU01014839.1:43-687(-)